MHTAWKKFGAAAVAALSLAGATLATSTSAEARYFHRGWGGGWAGPAIVGGLALGALAASRPYYGYGYGPGYYGAYGDGYYGGDCVLRRRVHYTRTALSCDTFAFATDVAGQREKRLALQPSKKDGP